MTADLAGVLDRLDKAATPGPWEQEWIHVLGPRKPSDLNRGPARLFSAEVPYDGADGLCGSNIQLIVWLRNHTDEIKAALSVQPGMSQALIDMEERALAAEAERDRWIDADERDCRALRDALAEVDRLRATVQRCEALAEKYEKWPVNPEYASVSRSNAAKDIRAALDRGADHD